MRATIRILVVLGLALFCVSCGGGGGETAPVATVPSPPPPPPPPPPVAIACTGVDTFPGFLYVRESTAELHLASSDGCRSELVIIVPELRVYASMHMTVDRSAGVIVWAEEIESQYAVRRLDFTVDASGHLELEPAVTILPLAGEEPLPGELHSYFVGDVWGDATHDSLYLAVSRHRQFNSGPNAGKNMNDALIYDLNDLTDNSALPAPDVRTIYHRLKPIGDAVPEVSEWLDATDPMTFAECQLAPYPQFSPTCYAAPEEMSFNPSGTRLYLGNGGLWGELQDPGTSWDGVMRIETDDMAAGIALADWNLAGPELVYAVDQRSAGELSGPVQRPDYDPLRLPSPEYIAVSQGEDSDAPRSELVFILDADQCATVYAPHASGMLAAPSDLWQECKDESTFYTGTRPSGGYSWQSPDAMLKDSYQRRDTSIFDIHRVYFSGGLAGTEQLVIESASGADTGY
jgi:hypothetical protein